MKIKFKGLRGILLKERSWECKEVLARALTKDQCYDFRYVRKWAACRAWEKMERDRAMRFGTAMEEAWRELKAECTKVGAEI